MRKLVVLGASLGAVALVATGGVASEAADSTGVTQRVSVDSSGVQANGASAWSAISADGRFVAFASGASNLIPGDSNGRGDIFVRDLLSETTERVSMDGSGGEANNFSIDPSISGDGRFVAFESWATNLVPDDTNGLEDVFVRDRETGSTERVSVDSSGGQADFFSNAPSISADGRFVAFESSATNLIAADTNTARDIFVHDRQTGISQRVSIDSSGGEVSDDSRLPAISADGRFVSFWSSAGDLVPNDTNNKDDVFVHDRQTGITERVSVDSSGVQATGGQTFPEPTHSAISTDGRFVAFTTDATNLVPGDTNATWDTFVRDRLTGTTERVSTDSSGSEGNERSGNGSLAISGDGRFIAFSSFASNLVPADTNDVLDVFVRDRLEDATERVSVDNVGVEGNGYSFMPALTADGGMVAFESPATNFVADDTNGVHDVFLHETTTAPPPPPPMPSIASFSPLSGSPGTTVTISGTNLLGATSVLFNSTPTTSFTVISSTQITAVVPSSATSGPIMVRTPAGDALSSSSFTVVPRPGRPVLMIHGIDVTAPYGDNCAVTWDDAKEYLRANGFADRELLTVAYYEQDANCDRPINDSVSLAVGNSYFDEPGTHAGTANGHTAEAAIEHLGYHLAWFIFDEYSSRGVSIDILAHSMGGLIARYALAEVAAGNPAFPPRLLITNSVTFGTPHGGARIGGLGLCKVRTLGLRECSEMKAGSALLTGLEQNGWNPQGDNGTDWTVVGSDEDTWVAADRAVGTSRNRQTNLYFGACHKVWYPSVRREGKRRVKQRIEHSDYMHDGSIVRGMDATNLATYSSADRCGAPLENLSGQRHPMGQAALALASPAY